MMLNFFVFTILLVGAFSEPTVYFKEDFTDGGMKDNFITCLNFAISRLTAMTTLTLNWCLMWTMGNWACLVIDIQLLQIVNV